MAVTTVKIFPSIGIARLGNSPSGFFVGPELPGDRTPPAGGYKDASCRIKRQAARFRLFGYDANGGLVGEITQADARIVWTVHLANTKAAARQFAGLDPKAPLRNSGPLPGVSPIADRSTLSIDPGPRSLSGANQNAVFDSGTFLGSPVPLGEIRTESDGRLIVLGGFGNSNSPFNVPLTTFANNDRWHDDVSDGPVTAQVTLNGTNSPVSAVPAWVICGPPDFAPPVDSVTTLWDVLFQVAVDKGWLHVPATPSLSNDVYPILRRSLAIEATYAMAAGKHDVLFGAAFPAGGAADRAKVVGRVNDPNNVNGVAGADMPMLFNDSNAAGEVVTRAQYEVLTKWRDGTFKADWTGSPPPADAAITPDGLTRAALESCVGGALFPGIEASWFLRSTYPYSEPFRLDPANLAAGDITKQMSVPWQADFFDCTMAPGGDSSLAWWPAQRPDDVFPEAGGAQVPWIRDIVASGQDMVDNWHKLGFVVARGAKLVETERSKVCRSLSFIIDKGEYFEDDVAALLSVGSPARFVAAIHVLADGFVPSDLGITRRDPSPAELVALAPTVTFARSDGTAVPSMTAIVQALLLQDPSLPAGQGQRCTFTYAVDFSGTDAFSAGSSPVELQTVAANATKALPDATFTASVDLQLSNRANPFMLATDLRVFQAAEGETVHRVSMGTNASTFVSDLLTAFNAAPAANHPFDTLASDPAASPLELSDTVAGKTVFNFAVARVRYRGHSNANDIRLFFRLFTTAASGLNYDVATTYRRGLPRTAPVALLGLQAGGIVTIPCFGGARVDSSTTALIRQTDEVNHKTLRGAFGGEVHAYFGCWLDFNQVSPQFPSHPAPPDGPWPSQRRSIQQLMRGLQPSLVSEIYYPTDLIPAGATPSSNAKLCHVNLVLHDSGVPPTPGPLVTHHTFEIQASPPARRGSPTGAAPNAEELVIRWGSLPGGSLVTLYVPGMDADQILRLAGQLHESSTLERIDAHSIGCRPAHITYIPLPAGRMKNAQALLTVTIPPPGPQTTPVNVTVSQIAGQPRRTLGTFQVVIPPGGATGQPGAPANPTPLLGHLASNIAVDDPWHAIFNRLDPGTTVAVHPEPKSPMAIHPEPKTPVAVHPEPTSTT